MPTVGEKASRTRRIQREDIGLFTERRRTIANQEGTVVLDGTTPYGQR